MRSKRRRELACPERGFEPSAPSGRCSEGRIGRNREYCKRQRCKTTIFQPALWVSRSESRRGYKAAHCSLFISTPQSHFVRQLPGRGAFWHCTSPLLSRPWQQLPRSFAEVARHEHERSCYEQPQRGKAGEQAHLCIRAERELDLHLCTFCQVCAEG